MSSNRQLKVTEEMFGSKMNTQSRSSKARSQSDTKENEVSFGRTLKVVLNRNEVTNYMNSLEKGANKTESTKPPHTVTNEVFEPTKRTQSHILKQRPLQTDTNKSGEVSFGRTLKVVLNQNEVKNNIKSLENGTNKATSTNRKQTIKKQFPAMTMKTRSSALKDSTIESTKRKRDETDDKGVKSQPKRSLKDNKSNEIFPSEQQIEKSSSFKQTKRRVVRMPKTSQNALMPILHVNELVWAYIKGYPAWPGVIEEFLPNGKILVHFFGDYTRGQITRRFIMNYFEGFNQFASNFGNIKLKKAVEEAKYFLFDQDKANECYVCKVLESKRQFLREKQLSSTNDE